MKINGTSIDLDWFRLGIDEEDETEDEADRKTNAESDYSEEAT